MATALDTKIDSYAQTGDPQTLAEILRQLACLGCAEGGATGGAGEDTDLLFFSVTDGGDPVLPGGSGRRTYVIPAGSQALATDVTAGGVPASGILLDETSVLLGARLAQLAADSPAGGPHILYEIVVAPPATPFDATTGVVVATLDVDPAASVNAALLVTNAGPFPAGSSVFAVAVAAIGAASPLGIDVSATLQPV